MISSHQSDFKSKLGVFSILATLFLWPGFAFAASGIPSAATMFENFGNTATSLMDIVVATAFVCGLVITIVGLLKLREYAEAGGRMKLSTPLGVIAVGTLLVIMPGMINTATETLSLGANTGKSVLSQGGGGGSDAVAAMSGAIHGILLFVKLIGHIAFFRGLLILKRLAEGNGQTSMGAALLHIFGGAAAINITATADVFSTLLKIDLPI